MTSEQGPAQDLLLIGGGHAHVLVLRRLAMSAPPSLRITLVSPDPFTPYSGMLPGLLAGHYSFADGHIDLARLCQWAGVRFLADRIVAIDPVRRRARCARRGELGYDLVSIDVGSQPEIDSVPGARQHAIPVKPVSGLWRRWQSLTAGQGLAGRQLAIVGGGAGSVEIALAVAHRLGAGGPRISLYCGGARVLEGYAPATRRIVERQLKNLGVELRCDHRVTRVDPNALHFQAATAADYDTLIWCTGAAAAPWVADSALPTDERGFMLVDDTMQSTGFTNVFGAGDIATQYRHPRPKAGVYAVRQGPVLAGNLLAVARGDRLREHRPQRRFLSMLSLGPRLAVAERNGLSVHGALVWRWKDRIDRKFMRRFSELPPRGMPAPASPAGELQAHCGGCGAKLAADMLSAVLGELRREYPAQAPDERALDDAVLIDATAPLMQSVDALRALVDDPWRMGRIAAQHALSDLHASGARPHSAQALVTLPFAAPSLLRRDLSQTLAGALSVFAESGCRLLGGHSMQGSEFQLGFAVNGTLGGRAPLRTRGARVGDVLILSKPLGFGALFAAHMQARADGRDVEQALAAMEQGNGAAAACARTHGASAVTDVTGFGLAGHLLAMLGDELGARINVESLPVLGGALRAMDEGIFSTLHEENRAAVAGRCAIGGDAPPAAQLLFDPQTSGGLLLAVAPDSAEAALAELRAGATGAAAGAAIIGEVIAVPAGPQLSLSAD